MALRCQKRALKETAGKGICAISQNPLICDHIINKPFEVCLSPVLPNQQGLNQRKRSVDEPGLTLRQAQDKSFPIEECLE